MQEKRGGRKTMEVTDGKDHHETLQMLGWGHVWCFIIFLGQGIKG